MSRYLNTAVAAVDKLPTTMIPVYQITPLRAIILLVGLWLLTKVVCSLRRRAKSTPLKGPPSKSLIFGNSRFLIGQNEHDPSRVYEEWTEQYGAVFSTPIALGLTKVIVSDPKAIQHIYSMDTYRYIQVPMTKTFINNMVWIMIWTMSISMQRVRFVLR
jgi:hypothetical protein